MKKQFLRVEEVGVLLVRDREADFSGLIDRVREGCQEAAWELIASYGSLVFRVVRSRLPKDLRRVFDSQDFVQVVWGSVFRHRSRLVRFDRSEEFVAFLATVAANKVRMEIRRRCRQQKHNIHREVPFDLAGEIRPGTGPTPSQLAMAKEQWFRLLENQPVHYQEIIRLSYLGYNSGDIARRVGLDEGSVRRILRNIFKGATP